MFKGRFVQILIIVDMKSTYVVILAALHFILLESPTVLPVRPICLTWHTSSSYLTIECSVMFATHDIVLVDQFGKTRGRCFVKDSLGCSVINTYELVFVKKSDNLTTLTLKTDKNTAEGEWTCRHGNDEKKTSVSYLRGSVPLVDIEVSHETRKVNETNRFKLTCSSCMEPFIKGVDIRINNVSEDSIQYSSGLCYHKQKLCAPVRCSCLAGGKYFSWTFISNLTLIQFTCVMRFMDVATSSIVVKKAHVIYNGSVFIKKQKPNESINHSDKPPENTNKDKEKTTNLGYIGYAIVGIVGLIILIIVVICICRILNNKRKSASDMDKKTEDLLVPLQDQHSKDTLQLYNGTETTNKCELSLKHVYTFVKEQPNIDRFAFLQVARGQLDQFGFCVLKDLGIEVEDDRVSFHMNVLQSLGEHQYLCLHETTDWLFRKRSFGFLRLYDVFTFDLEDLKHNKNLYNELYKIFKMIIDMKNGKSWYHYRRNGLTCEGSSEGAFTLVKQVFLNQKLPDIFTNFSSYESRLGTFQNYPIKTKSYREKLAEAGFFYFQVSDYVQCFNCGGCLRDWKDMIDPLIRHIETFSTCEYAMDCVEKRNSAIDVILETNEYQQTYEDRLSSFKTFPATLSKADLKQLAVAGFYYYGIAEDIVCYACNIGFSNIEHTEHILRQHEICSPGCPLISMSDNQAKRKDKIDQENISFVQYLELEYRSHDSRFQNI